MGIEDEVGEFDRHLDQAWGDFERGLTQVMRTASKDAGFVLRMREPDVAGEVVPYVKVIGVGPGRVRALVSSNLTLHPRHQLSAEQIEALLADRWREPWTGRNGADYASITTATQYGRVARMVTRVLRDVLGLPHPALVFVEGLDGQGQALLGIGDARLEAAATAASVVVPRDVEELTTLAREALLPLAGPDPLRCEHGGFVIPASTTQIVVHVSDVDVIQIEALVVCDVVDAETAYAETNRLNGETGLVRFVSCGRDIFLQAELLSRPFVPSHLRDVVMMAAALIEQRTDDLVARTHGRRPPAVQSAPSPGFSSPSDSAPGVDPLAAATGPYGGTDGLPDELVQLVALAGVGPVSTRDAARICSHDAAWMRTLTTIAHERASSCAHWARLFRRGGDTCAALDLEVEAERLRAAVEALRDAAREAERGD